MMRTGTLEEGLSHRFHSAPIVGNLPLNEQVERCSDNFALFYVSIPTFYHIVR